MGNMDAADIQDTNYQVISVFHKCECRLPVIERFQQPETSSHPFLSEVDNELQTEITKTKIVFLKDVVQWPDNMSEQLRGQFLIEKPNNMDIQTSKSIQEVKDRQAYRK